MVVTSSVACKYSTWYWQNQDTGEIKGYNCGSWSCPQHQGATAYKWAARLAVAHPERMVTITNIPRDKVTAYHGFMQLVRDIRAEGIRFEYCRFLEVGHNSGMQHFHIAQRGDYIPKFWLSSRADANGLGRIVDIEACHGAGPAWYLAKYVTKEAGLPGWRKVAASRHFWPAREVPSDIRDAWVLMKPGHTS